MTPIVGNIVYENVRDAELLFSALYHFEEIPVHIQQLKMWTPHWAIESINSQVVRVL